MSPPTPPARAVRVAYSTLFVVMLLLHVRFVAIGWTHTLLDRHPFRQTQTALGARSLLEGSPFLAYELPVFGKPWGLPIEFPLYQAAVAGLVAATPLPLEQAGRLVSLAAFYLTLPFLYAGLAVVVPDRSRRLLVLAFVLASPLYIFWSRTVLIESTALLFATAYVVLAIQALERPRFTAPAIAAGVLVALVKATTLVVAFVPVLAYFALRARRRVGLAILLLGVPVASGQAWTWFANGIRVRNPLAEVWTSLAHFEPWTYGTLAQRLDGVAWKWMFARSLPTLAGAGLVDWMPLAVIIGAAGLAVRGPYRVPALVALAAFLAGPLVFFNVYAVHEYYFYANGIYLLIFCAFGVLALAERLPPRVAIALPAALLALLLISYLRDYLVSQQDLRDVPRATTMVQRLTKPGDVIAIYGEGWSSAVPYYAERRALMDPDFRAPGDPRLVRALRNLQGERIGAVVVSGTLRDDAAALAPRLALFGCAAPPVYHDTMTDIYVPGTMR